MTSRFLKSLFVTAFLGVVFVAFVLGSGLVSQMLTAQDYRHSSVTGYFGVDADCLPIPDRYGVMLVFDGAIKTNTLSVNTIRVSLNDGTFAEVVETRVEGPFVFLRLADELASDATPILGISEGEEVEDLAGNSTNQRKFGFAQVKDGIAPRMAINLSGGSGRGAGDEGPDRLTNASIDIRITSDEPLQGAPRVFVVCEDLSWIERDGSRAIESDIDDFIANRNGPFSVRPQEPPGTAYTCGYDADDDGMEDVFELTEDVAHSRPGQVWELTWHNPTGLTTSLMDGELAVVAYGRDRSRYDRYGETVSNWATAKGGFGFDTRFGSEALLEQVKLQPPDGSVVRERRPFVLLEFPEATSVNLASVVFDGEEIVDEFEVVRSNEFVYWPMSMNQGQHTVEVEANDSAGNETEFEFHFETTRRGDFVLPLVAGWNAVSVPADPIDSPIESVLTDPAIEAVASWDVYSLPNPWTMSLRKGDSWEPVVGSGVSEVVADRGYWVKSSQFVEQPIALTQTANVYANWRRQSCGLNPGWYFVGVTGKNGAQTQGNFGEPLRNLDGDLVTVGEYLFGEFGSYFFWDPIDGKFRRLSPKDAATIGAGIWAYFGAAASCP
ncbi:MAG: hypothetical protein F4X40_01980 [Chloroflexi bacterium]|nr:hypothetical protein [Chloroflexota bacterium]